VASGEAKSQHNCVAFMPCTSSPHSFRSNHIASLNFIRSDGKILVSHKKGDRNGGVLPYVNPTPMS